MYNNVFGIEYLQKKLNILCRKLYKSDGKVGSLF